LVTPVFGRAGDFDSAGIIGTPPAIDKNLSAMASYAETA
jgi:hypothetical protein